MSKNEKLSGAANRINRALQHRLSGLSRFGQSKHEAKAAAKKAYLQEHGNLKGYNPSKVEGIYSIRTMESYRQTAKEFAKWAANKGCKNANKINREIVGKYLQERQSNGKSPWTTSKDMAAL
ncbi:MAG: site-specific integrase, partial [Clostridiales bacterium]|nr:site-specific integrase [Clostridiales bacterium]